jgi:hypothetical protein
VPTPVSFSDGQFEMVLIAAAARPAPNGMAKTLDRFVNVTIMCHCREDQQRCHRHLLKKMLDGKITESADSNRLPLSSFFYLNDSPVDAYFRQKSLNRVGDSSV